MKKIIAILLVLTLALSFAACNKQEQGPVSYDDHFNRETPEDKTTHTKYTLERVDFDQYIESVSNLNIYPDLLKYDATTGEMQGIYIYDPETGLATGWTNTTTGEVHTFEAGKEVNLGKPDPTKMVDVATIKLGVAVYEQDSKVTGAELYFFLSDAKDAATLIKFMSERFGEPLVKESDTVYKVVKDAEAVQKDFAREEQAGMSFYSKNAAEYMNVLKMNYGVAPVE